MIKIYRFICGKNHPGPLYMCITHGVIGNKTPEEMFTDENPKVIHLRIFGFPLYVHVAKEKRSKLNGIYFGYSDTSKAYRVYIPSHWQIETSRYVTFNEDATFSKSRQHHSEEIHDEDPEVPELQIQMQVMMLY
jgi:hypothetical protein